MRDIPVNLGGYTLLVTEEPTQKTRERNGKTEFVVDNRTGAALFTVSLLVKQQGQRGEEIKIDLEADPGEGFEAFRSVVELVDARLNYYEFTNDEGNKVSGIKFRAAGLKPVA